MMNWKQEAFVAVVFWLICGLFFWHQHVNTQIVEVIDEAVPQKPWYGTKGNELAKIKVKLNKKFSEDSAIIYFMDGTNLMAARTCPPVWTSPPPGTDEYYLYLDFQTPPYGVKTVEEFKAKLPLRIKFKPR